MSSYGKDHGLGKNAEGKTQLSNYIDLLVYLYANILILYLNDQRVFDKIKPTLKLSTCGRSNESISSKKPLGNMNPWVT